MGHAYGLFDCHAAKIEIEAELPFIRELVLTPASLEHRLHEGIAELHGDAELLEFARSANLRYVLEARCDEKSNNDTAAEIGQILIQAYNSPLYQENEPFNGFLAFKDEPLDKYVFVKSMLWGESPKSWLS